MRHRGLRAAALVSAVLLLTGLPAVAQHADPIGVKGFLRVPGMVLDPRCHVSFNLPPGWVLMRGQRWGDHETTLNLRDPESEFIVSLYYQYPLQQPYTDAARALQEALDAKIYERQMVEAVPDYRVPLNRIHTGTVGEHPALSFVSEFTRQGRSQLEYILKVLGKKTKAQFFVTVSTEEDLQGVLGRLKPAMESLKIE